MVDLNQITVSVNDIIPPANIATIDQDNFVGNTLTKTQLNQRFDSVKDELTEDLTNIAVSGVKGEAIPTSSPTPYNPTTYPKGLYEKWDVKIPGTYTNFINAGTPPLPIEISAGELKENLVQIWVTNGVSQKVLKEFKPDLEVKSLRAYDPILKTSSAGVVDTYTVYFNDNTTTTFSLINGKDGVSIPTMASLTYPSSLPIPSGYFKTGVVNDSLITIQNKEPAFILVVKTDNAGVSASNQFTFVGVGTYRIDWGDGVIENKTNTATHTYTVPGTYTIKITGALNYIRYANGSDHSKLMDIKNWGSIPWTSFQDAFWACENLKLTATDYPDLSAVTVFQRAFMGCTNFKGHESMKGWDMSHVTNVQNMFSTSGFNTDITNWRFSKNLTLLNGFFFKTQIGLGGPADSDIMNMFIINLANWAYGTNPVGTPVNVNAGGHGKYYTNKKYTVSGQFNNAIDAMAYLTGTLNWTWAEPTYAKTVLQDGQFDKGYMVIGVDDGYISWNNLFEPLVLRPRNIKATFFVSQAYIDVPTQPTYTNWTNIRALYDKGHNIENHTWEHKNLGGADFDEKRTRDGVDKIDAKLAENGMPRSLHISYPFGGHTENTKKWLRHDTFLKTGRMTRINPIGTLPEFDGLITTKVDKFAIPCEPFTGTMTNGKLERFKMLLDQAKAEKKALVVYAHEFTENDAAVINDNWITIALAQAICDYCISIGVKIITHDKLYNLLD